MKQDNNKIYNEFKKAGLEKQVRQMSTSVDGKIIPSLGHYVAILDNLLELEKTNPGKLAEENTNNYFKKIMNELMINLPNPDAYEDLISKLNEIKGYAEISMSSYTWI
jgi:hypothetical protein